MPDWQEIDFRAPTTAVVDPRRRLWWCLWGFAAMLLVVFGRAVQLEWSYGPAFRDEANRPLIRHVSVPGVRGRLLSRDGAVLACDRQVFALAIHFREIEEPCNPVWLRRTARSRLTPAQRRDARRVTAEEAQVVAERRELARRAMVLAGLTPRQWESRTRQIQSRVQRIAESADRRRQDDIQHQREKTAEDASDDSFWTRLGARLQAIFNASAAESSRRLVVAEETDYHVVAEDVPLSVVAEVEQHPDRYRGLKIVERWRRSYPCGALAAHALGHLGPLKGVGSHFQRQTEEPPADTTPDPFSMAEPEDFVGRAGLERQYEPLLFGHRGVAVELTDHGGRIVSTYRQREPGIGRDLVLTLDARLQAAAETLLDQALQRRTITQADAPPAGGAIVVLDVHSGALLAAASAPRFKPGLFAGGGSPELTSLLADPAHPLFDRVTGMAIPPGSVFKVVTSIALLENAVVHPDTTFACRGYLDSPDQLRCAVFTRHGHGHGPVTLADALAQSCNVYFFHHARQMGPMPLVDWADRLGCGRPTGIDVPGEASGMVPSHATLAGHTRAQRTADALAMSIGQGTLTATPLQVAQLIAAVANGGQRVHPHLVSGLALSGLRKGVGSRFRPEEESGKSEKDSKMTPDPFSEADDPIRIAPPEPIAALQPATLAAIRAGLQRAVEDPAGTAYGTVHLDSVAVAGKTGTAQTGAGQPDHAWFAGYLPADRPRWALVVVLEYAGDAATAAGPVVRRLVQHMQQLGLVE